MFLVTRERVQVSHRKKKKRHVWVGGNVRRTSVQSDTDRLEFRLEKRPLLGALGRVQHHEDEIARLGGRNDLATAALALGGALDDTRQIEQLNLGAAVLEHTGNGRQRREGVRGGLGLGLGDF